MTENIVADAGINAENLVDNTTEPNEESLDLGESTEEAGGETNEQSKKSNLKKVFEERTALRKKVEELESRLGDTKKSDPEHLNLLVEKKVAEQRQKEMYESEMTHVFNDYGEAVEKEVREIREANPNLSLEQSLRLSELASEVNTTSNPQKYSAGGKTPARMVKDSSSITQAEMVQLPQAQFNAMRDKIDKGEIKLIL